MAGSLNEQVFVGSFYWQVCRFSRLAWGIQSCAMRVLPPEAAVASGPIAADTLEVACSRTAPGQSSEFRYMHAVVLRGSSVHCLRMAAALFRWCRSQHGSINAVLLFVEYRPFAVAEERIGECLGLS